MSVKSAHQKRAQKSIIYLTFFILLSIPLIIFGLSQDDFDLRKRAFEDLQLSDENPCLISLPNVNPYSLEVDKTVTVQVEALLKDQGISKLEILDSEGQIVYEEFFDTSPIEIATSFPFTPKEAGKVSLSGIIETTQDSRVDCQITSEYGIRGLRAVSSNTAPEFTTSPTDSIPSQNIVTGDNYEYTLKATDVDGDRINYAYSFTPRADWLNLTVINDGSDGRLTLKFSGSTQKAASYLANVFIHDGYSKNLRSQSWVINVSPSENDIPVVTIIDPARSIRVDKGTTFKTSWQATDLNHIIGYEIFITNNLANEETWIEIDGDVPYDTTSYNVDTSGLASGTYKIVTTATDNQQPPATGKGVSPEIVITTVTEDDPDTDDGVLLGQPQVTNMSPLSTEEITNRRVTVRATIVASANAQINESSILFRLDNRDITDDIKINRISQKEFTLIYQPEEDLDEGLHKAEIIFSDSDDLVANKSWNFTIQPDDTISDDVYNIFGYEVAKSVVHIVGVGVITVVLALITPFIIFSIWKEDKDDSTEQVNAKLPPSIPTDDTEYIESVETDDTSRIRGMVTLKTGSKDDSSLEKEDEKESKEKDVWDKYSAPKPILTEEQREKDLKSLDEKEEKKEEVAETKEKKPEEIEEVTETKEEKPEEIEEVTETKEEKPEEIEEVKQVKEVGLKEKPQKDIITGEEKQENKQQTPKKEEQAPPPTPKSEPKPEPSTTLEKQKEETQPTGEPQIPEPEIPEISDLENISKQLQEIKEQEEQGK